MGRAITAAALGLVLPAALLAQEPGRARITTGAEYYSVKYETGSSSTTVSEMVAPLGLFVPLGQRFSFEVGTYFVNAQMTSGTTDESISGLTDVIVRTAWQLKPDVATLTFSASLPTGQTEFTQQQLTIAGNVSSDLIPFPVTTFGTGFTATTGLAVAVPLGSWAMGLAGAYRYSGEYTPVDSGPVLTPGSEFRARIGLDRLVGQGRLSLGVTYSTFTQDEFGAARAAPGPRIISQISWGFPIGNSSLSLYAWDVYRGKGDSVATLPVFKENTIAVGTIGAFRLGGNLLRPSLEFRMQSSTINGTDSDGNLIGAGLRYQIQAGRRATIIPGVRFDVGTSQNVDFTGLSGSLSLRIGL
jgi:hypothetical protein